MTATDSGDGSGTIGDAREGMPVLDVAGQRVGTVATVKLGDPHAATSPGPSAPQRGLLLDPLRGATSSGPKLPPQQAEHLNRVGYLEIHGEGSVPDETYVPADQVARVTEGTVHLRVGHAELLGRA